MDITLEHWERLTSTEREAFAKKLTSELPTGFAFSSITSFALGSERHEIAIFKLDGADFALLPGGSVALGYDPGRQWVPTLEEQSSWKSTAEEFEVDWTLEEQIARTTLAPRTVDISPVLIETVAQEVNWEKLRLDDPEVKELLRKYESEASTMIKERGSYQVVGSIRCTWTSEGSVTAERPLKLTHSKLTKELSKAGFRFPTLDEWEYACGAGARTLFRWGDHAPCDRTPLDINAANHRWGEAWVESHGTLSYPPQGFQPDWDLHRRPNAFGIYIASDPYKSEVLAEPGVTRGGDGGAALCGGLGFFVGWLTLATAYFEEHTCRRNPKKPVDAGYAIGRRVLALQ